LSCRQLTGEDWLFSSIMDAAVSQPKLVIPGAPRMSPLFCPEAAAKLKELLVTAVRTNPPAQAVLFPSSVNVALYLAAFAALPLLITTPNRNTVFPTAKRCGSRVLTVTTPP